MADVLAPPFGPPPLFLIVAAGLLILLALWLGWRISRLRARPRLTPLEIRTWQAKIDEALSEHGGDPRVTSLALAKVLRDWGSERWGVSMGSMTAAEIEALTGRAGLAGLVRELEESSFSPAGTADVERLAHTAKATVGSW